MERSDCGVRHERHVVGRVYQGGEARGLCARKRYLASAAATDGRKTYPGGLVKAPLTPFSRRESVCLTTAKGKHVYSEPCLQNLAVTLAGRWQFALTVSENQARGLVLGVWD